MPFTKGRERNVDHFCHMICGFFTQDEIVEAEDDDDLDEEDDDIQFLNYYEMNGVGQGKQLYEGKKMRKCEGILKDLDRPNVENKVVAPFHFTDPWWKITMLRTAFETKGTKRRYPKDATSLTYKIRQDDKVVRDKLVNMFLTKMLNDGQGDSYVYIDEFLQYVEHSGNKPKLKFEHLEELLDDFFSFLPEDRKCSAERVMKALNTPEWLAISKALKYPKLVEMLSQLLPNQFKSIMDAPENGSLFSNLNKALEIKPWVFGYKQLLFKDYDLTGCEASLLSIQRAEIFSKLEQVHKDALVIYDFLKTDSRKNGHTQISLIKLKQKIQEECSQIDEALKFLKRNKITKEIEINEDTKICLQQLWNYERKISEGISLLFNKQLSDPWKLDVDLDSEDFDQIRGDREQHEAAKKLLKYPVVVISGKGGCGKTTVVTKVLSHDSNCQSENATDSEENKINIDFDDCKFSQKARHELDDSQFPNSEDFCSGQDTSEVDKPVDLPTNNEPVIVYTAPTGKAANLLGRRAQTTGYTLHQIIWSYRFYITKTIKDNPDAKWKFRHVKTLVVDECSMVAVSTFSTLLTTLLENAKLRKVVLLGDVRQLPSIEPGNFLADVYRTLVPVDASIELMTNHRAESNLIVTNATAISLKQYPLFSKEHKFDLHEVPQSEDKDTDMHDTVVHRILRDQECLQDDTRSQFVTFTNKNCDIINELACKFYNNHTCKNHKNRLDLKIKDKICLKKNGLVMVYEQDASGQINHKYLDGELEPEQAADAMEVTLMSQTMNETTMNQTASNSDDGSEKKKKTPATIRLCNGEIYFIKDESKEIDNRGKQAHYLKFSDEDKDCPREFWVNYKEVMRKCKIKHSWARTIHTFQGSECENLVYVVGFTKFLQNWQHVYTAVTRGKKQVHIVGTKQCLRMAITKDPTPRNTTLQYQLADMLPIDEVKEKIVQEKDEPMDQSSNSSQKQISASKNCLPKNIASSSCASGSSIPSTSTPLFTRIGDKSLKRKSLGLGGLIEELPRSPFSDSQWSDYGDDTYIQATQIVPGNNGEQNSFNQMDSLEMSENSELNGDLTAACDIIEASFAREEEELKNIQRQHGDSFTHINQRTKSETSDSSKGSNSLFGNSDIEEYDSFSATPRKDGENTQVTPKKRRVSPYPQVSPTRKLLTQLSFK